MCLLMSAASNAQTAYSLSETCFMQEALSKRPFTFSWKLWTTLALASPPHRQTHRQRDSVSGDKRAKKAPQWGPRWANPTHTQEGPPPCTCSSCSHLSRPRPAGRSPPWRCRSAHNSSYPAHSSSPRPWTAARSVHHEQKRKRAQWGRREWGEWEPWGTLFLYCQ